MGKLFNFCLIHKNTHVRKETIGTCFQMEPEIVALLITKCNPFTRVGIVAETKSSIDENFSVWSIDRVPQLCLIKIKM